MLSIKLVSDSLSYVLSATTGNLTVDPPPAVREANADFNAAVAPGLNAPDNAPAAAPVSAPVIAPAAPLISPNADAPDLIDAPMSDPENALAPTSDNALVTGPRPSAIALTAPLALSTTLSPNFCPPGKLLTPDAIVLDIELY